MAPTPTSPPDSLATCIPYAEATPQQLSLALTYVMGELGQHFPKLSFPAWANALLHLQPDLWVEGDLVYLDYEDLTHLTQRLATSPELPQLDPPIYRDRARYLAKRLVNYWDQAINALGDIEANPQAYGPRVYALVLDLALGNSVADEVFQATHRGPQGRPGSPDPDLARAGAQPRVAALRRARGELGYS